MKLVSYGVFLKSKSKLSPACVGLHKNGNWIHRIFDWKMGLALWGLACLKVRVGKNK